MYLLFLLSVSSCYIQHPLSHSVSVKSETGFVDSAATLCVKLCSDEELIFWHVALTDTAGNELALKRPEQNLFSETDTVALPFAKDFVVFDSLPDSIPLRVSFRSYGYYRFDTLIHPLTGRGLKITVRPVVNPDEQSGCTFEPLDVFGLNHLIHGPMAPLNREFPLYELNKRPLPR
ncbi:MAG: hypothetical protein IM638_00520 [Bacteroidetes bacterium]|nr:hypothetical protein [Bacteroidota bacterium]